MFLKYLKSAFLETFGMPAPLSCIILAFTAVGTYMDWGLGIVGIGGFAAYLFLLANSNRYMRYSDGKISLEAQKDALSKVQKQLNNLPHDDEARYHDLVHRCDTIMKQQAHETLPEELQQQATGLSKLVGFYLQLLVSKSIILNAPSEDDPRAIQRMITALQKKITATNSPDVKRSLNGQLDILNQRLQAQHGVSDRLEYLESELQRIEQQVELLREQTVADTAPKVVSDRIDAVTSSLSTTNDWMKKNQELMGQLDDVFAAEPPPVLQVLQQH